jgi:flavin reductase (DIM6/NTAB) family NADH-FMN oxidoreductase RutF
MLPAARVAGFRDLMAAWPTGIAIVTGADEDRPVGCTVTALASISVAPPLLLVSLAQRSRTLAAIEWDGRFGVSVLPSTERNLARSFATGDPSGRFARVGYEWVLGTPVLCDAVAAAVCAVSDHRVVADHMLLIGEPMWQHTNAGRAPAIWYQRDFRELVAPGGFSLLGQRHRRP